MAVPLRPEPRRWWALAALALSVLVVGLDLTVLNLALPTLSRELHASTADLQWIVDSYSLVLAAALLPAGLLGDRFGRGRICRVRVCRLGGVPDRHPGRSRPWRGRDPAAVAGRAAGSVHRRRAAQGDRRRGRRHFHQLSG